MNTIWKQRRLPEGASPELCGLLSEECGVSPIVAAVMVRRGCTTIEEGMAWLDPQWEDLHDPFQLPDMEIAVERILSAREQGEIICIYGDYDADGTTGTAILLKYFDTLGINAFHRIPNRLKEGYGLNLDAVDHLVQGGACSLLITVDNGISAFSEVARAMEKGLDVIITDHHECQEKLPEALAVVDAKRSDSQYPFSELCGAGVAFKLVQAIDECLGLNSDLTEYLECAALATVADIVPLKDENRTIVSLGLQIMNDHPRNKGIAALIAVSEVDQVTAGNLGYVIAPKINAAGRLGNADPVIDLYLSQRDEEAHHVALLLKKENETRQAIEGEIYQAAFDRVKEEALFNNDFMIVTGKEWHSGVIGIVASKLQEMWFHPMIVIGVDEDGMGKGSCRSVPGVDIFEALCSCRHLFLSFGGHAMAAGFSIREEKIPELCEALKSWGTYHQVADHCVQTYYYDAQLSPEEIDFELYDELKRCEPCGVGNPGPVFKMEVTQAQKAKTMGKDRDHLSFEVAGLRCVGFGLGAQLPLILQGDSNILCKLRENRFNGDITVQPNIIDVKAHPLKDNELCWQWVQALKSEDAIESLEALKAFDLSHLAPDHQQTVAVYKAFETEKVTAVPFNVLRDGTVPMNSFQLLMALNALSESALLAFRLKNGIVYGKKLKSTEKKDIQKAPIMVKLYGMKVSLI